MNRKGKVEERKHLMLLFSEEPMQCLVSAAKNPGISGNEQHYLFKKKLVQVNFETQNCVLRSAN